MTNTHLKNNSSTFMRQLTSQYWLKYTSIVGVLLVASLIFFGINHKAAVAAGANEHVVTVYDRGAETTFITSAQTVGEALQKNDITLAAKDTTEPSVKTPLTAKNFNINIYRARPVLVTDGSTNKIILTARQDSREIAKSLGSDLYTEDIVTMQRGDNVMSNGIAVQVATIDRSTPFTLELYGKTVQSRTQAATVSGILAEKNIKLGPKDDTSLPGNTPVTSGMLLRIWRNGKQTVTVEEVVAFPTRQIKDADKEVGYKAINSPGKNGKQLATYEIEMQNGVEVARKQIAVVVTEPAIEQVETIGTKLTNTFSGSFAEALARLRSCESGGRYDRNSGNGYYGAYQYDISTWANWQGFARADLAPPNVQDEKVWETYKRRGWQPWPTCSIKMGLQDIYR